MLAQVNGTTLYYEKTGTGRPLVLVHGNGEDHTIFDEAVAVLRQHYTCYTPDSRGHGQSAPANELHYADMAADFVALIGALDLRDVAFYGFSDGGIVGLLAAAACPAITSLIVSGANITPGGVKPAARLGMLADYLRRRDPKTKLMLAEPHIPDALLGRITAKTLVLAGANDLIRERQTRRIAAAIPHAKLWLLPGEDHGSYVVHNPRIARLLLDFLREE